MRLLRRVDGVINCGGRGLFGRRMFVVKVDGELPRLKQMSL